MMNHSLVSVVNSVTVPLCVIVCLFYTQNLLEWLFGCFYSLSGFLKFYELIYVCILVNEYKRVIFFKIHYCLMTYLNLLLVFHVHFFWKYVVSPLYFLTCTILNCVLYYIILMYNLFISRRKHFICFA